MDLQEYKRTVLKPAKEYMGYVFLKDPGHPSFDYFAGLDLGFTHDATALCITELKYEPVGRKYTHTEKMPNYVDGGSVDVEQVRQRVRTIYHILHLDRVVKREPNHVVDDVVERLHALASGSVSEPVSVLIGVDATNDPTFVESLARKITTSHNPPFTPRIMAKPIAIRSNNETFRHSEETGKLLVPRNELLIRGGRSPLVGEDVVYVNGAKIEIPRRKQSRIRWRRNLPFKDVLMKELLSFEPQINVNTDYVRWEPRRREGYNHDDVAFAFCEAVLMGEMYGARDWETTHENTTFPEWDPADSHPTDDAGRSPLTGTPIPPLA